MCRTVVATRVLVEVSLMILLGRVPLACLYNLCCHLPLLLLDYRMLGLDILEYLFCNLLLLVGIVKDGTAVLAAMVWAFDITDYVSFATT